MNLAAAPARIVAQRLWRFYGQQTAEIYYAATVSTLFRLVFQISCLIEVSYRVEYGALSHVLNTFYVLGFIVVNVYVWWRIRSSGRVDLRWLFALSVMDIAIVSFSLCLSGGFDSRYFPMFYLAVALFAWVFSSPWLAFSWTTAVVVIYTVICLSVGNGVDFGQQEEKELFYRLLPLYAVAMSVNMVTRFERVRGLRAVARERELSRQRVEMSRTIHDTTAQSAYALGLGLEDAIETVDSSNGELVGKLEAMWEVSRSTMWALRHPIDGGEIFSGSRLGEVLEAHTDTFAAISSIPAELKISGTEPELSEIQRSLLFSIAHNAMTNAYRHSEAENVTVYVEFGEDRLCLSVSDDGIGLPVGWEATGHGFRNMRSDAERMGGALEVESSGHGTVVSCTVPYDQE